MDPYFWLALFFQVALIVLLVVAWKRSPDDSAKAPENPGSPPKDETEL